MSVIPGLAILLLATIGAARVIKVSLAAIRSACRYVRDVHRAVMERRACVATAAVVAVPAARTVSQADRDAIVEACLARLWREGNAGDTMVDVRAGRRARA